VIYREIRTIFTPEFIAAHSTADAQAGALQALMGGPLRGPSPSLRCDRQRRVGQRRLSVRGVTMPRANNKPAKPSKKKVPAQLPPTPEPEPEVEGRGARRRRG